MHVVCPRYGEAEPEAITAGRMHCRDRSVGCSYWAAAGEGLRCGLGLGLGLGLGVGCSYWAAAGEGLRFGLELGLGLGVGCSYWAAAGECLHYPYPNPSSNRGSPNCMPIQSYP